MRTRSSLPALAVLLFAASWLGVPAAADTVHVGDPLTVDAATPIAELVANADRFAGQTVRVEGRVTGVCQKMGCWMNVADDAGHTLQVKVEDGVIVFPAEAEGHDAAVQGAVEILDMERDEWVAWHKHLAEESGAVFDEASLGDGPYRLVRLRGQGADIVMQ